MALVDQDVGGESRAHNPELDRCAKKRVEPTAEEQQLDAGRLAIGPRENRTKRTMSRAAGSKVATSSTTSRSGGTPTWASMERLDV